jgi:menaquinone-specific isochorismate synthase
MTTSQRTPTPIKEAVRPLVARTSRIPKGDLLRFLSQHHSRPRFYYRSRGFALAGVGIAADLTADGPDRFGTIRDQSAALLARMGYEREPGVPSSVGPVWIGASAFESDVRSVETSVFPAARFFLPTIQWRAQADGLYVTTILARDEPAPEPLPEKRRLPSAAPTWTSEVTEAEWSQRVRRALRDIQGGAVQKIVLARSLRTDLPTAPDLSAILGRLQAITPQSTVFLVEPEPGHAWIGASPELLVRRSQTRLETAALAGSRRRGKTPDEDMAFERSLVASSKEAWEHELVCRFIRSTFETLGRDVRVTQDRGILKLPNVQHLETRFEASSPPGEHVLDIAGRLHPTPAVAGAPRDASLAIIRELEGRDRGWYGGAFGVFDAAGDGEFVVGIRSAQVEKKTVWLTAGCGIVSGSDPVEEWNESDVKFEIARRAFDTTRAA